ncbi:hypothetical protein ACFL3S_01645 [Gemmatimonadota bacterium]
MTAWAYSASALGAIAVTACAAVGPVTGSGGLRAIQIDEIGESSAEDLLELIENLRPSWLLGSDIRDPSDPEERGGPVVLVNDVPPRPLFTLQFMPLAGVEEIRYLTSNEAELRYRVRTPAGAILVKTRTPVGPGVGPSEGTATLD